MEHPEAVTVVDQITANSFKFTAEQFDGTGAVVVNTPKPGGKNINKALNFTLLKLWFIVFELINFQIVEGTSSGSTTTKRFK